MTNADKALAACADYVRICKYIKRLGRDIGDTLSRCPGTEKHGEGETHLFDYYRNLNAAQCLSSYPQRVKGRDEFEACSHCVATHELIQERKSARRSLGAVKRRITLIGKECA